MKMRVLYILMFVLTLFATDSFAQQRAASFRALEMGLQSLKESAAEIEKRNMWLRSEIELYQQSKDILMSEAQKRNEGGKAGQQPTFYISPEQKMLPDSIAEKPKKTHVVKMNRRPDQADKRLDQIQKQIQVVQMEIVELENQLKAFDSKSLGSENSEHRIQLEKLKSKIHVSQQRVDQLEDRLKEIKKENGDLLESYYSLAEEQELLKLKLVRVQTDLSKAFKEKEGSTIQLDELGQKHKKYLVDLNQDIAHLESRSKELEQVVQRAKRRLNSDKVDFKIEDSEIEQLMENLSVIQRENVYLQDELFRFKQKE